MGRNQVNMAEDIGCFFYPRTTCKQLLQADARVCGTMRHFIEDPTKAHATRKPTGRLGVEAQLCVVGSQRGRYRDRD